MMQQFSACNVHPCGELDGGGGGGVVLHNLDSELSIFIGGNYEKLEGCGDKLPGHGFAGQPYQWQTSAGALTLLSHAIPRIHNKVLELSPPPR